MQQRLLVLLATAPALSVGFLPAVLLPAPALHAQTSAPAAVASELSVRAEHLVDLAMTGQAYRILSDLIAAAPHRLSGSPGAEDAVRWAKAEMTALGLANVRLEEVEVPHWVRGDPEQLSVSCGGASFPVPVTALGSSVGADHVRGEIVVVTSFEQLHQLGEAAKGKIVLFNRPMSRARLNTFRAYGEAVEQRANGAAEAAKVGAVAALVRSMTTRLDDVPHTGNMHYQDGVPRVPAAAVSTAGAERIAALVAAGKQPTATLTMTCRTLDDVVSHNVIGEIRGNDKPDEIVLIGGHLDAWDTGNGAHDDGAGCAHTLEAMRLILAAGLRPRRTIRAVLFMNEENGLRGGRTYATEHGAEKHVAAIETDCGGFEPEGFSTSAKGARREVLESIASHLRPFYMDAMVPGGGGADISPLRENGVPLFGLVVSSHRYFDYHHSARDTLDAVNEHELALGAAALAYMASALADTDLPPAEPPAAHDR